MALKFYEDSGLSIEAVRLIAAQATDGSSPAVDRIVYLGAQDAGKMYQAESDPGVDDITISISDAAPGSGVAASAVKLALSSGGLAAATAGASLAVGVEVIGGSANAVAVYVRVDTPALTSGVYDDLTLVTNDLVEITL